MLFHYYNFFWYSLPFSVRFVLSSSCTFLPLSSLSPSITAYFIVSVFCMYVRERAHAHSFATVSFLSLDIGWNHIETSKNIRICITISEYTLAWHNLLFDDQTTSTTTTTMMKTTTTSTTTTKWKAKTRKCKRSENRFGEPKMIKSFFCCFHRCSRWFHFDAKKFQVFIFAAFQHNFIAKKLLPLLLLSRQFLYSNFFPVFSFRFFFKRIFFCCGSTLATYFYMIPFNGAYMNWMNVFRGESRAISLSLYGSCHVVALV